MSDEEVAITVLSVPHAPSTLCFDIVVTRHIKEGGKNVLELDSCNGIEMPKVCLVVVVDDVADGTQATAEGAWALDYSATPQN